MHEGAPDVNGLKMLFRCCQNKRDAVFDVFVLILGKHTLIVQNCLIVPNHCDVEKTEPSIIGILLHCRQSVNKKGQ